VRFGAALEPAAVAAVAEPEFAGALRAACGAALGLPPEAVLIAGVFDVRTGALTAFRSTDDVNVAGNREDAEAVLDALLGAFADLAEDSSTKVVILRGTGKAFCAGHDLKEMQAGRSAPDKGRAYFEGLFARCAKVMQTIPALPQPVIAQVHGIATAAGVPVPADLLPALGAARFGWLVRSPGVPAEIRLASLRPAAAPRLSTAPPAGQADGGFVGVLKNALGSVSAAQGESGRLQQAMQLEDPTVSLEQTMVAIQKAQIGFQATLHVRNRMVQAYTDIMNMQV
jgi:flagellar hook-basal body complex protein FliE